MLEFVQYVDNLLIEIDDVRFFDRKNTSKNNNNSQ
jgi:hypothetical protein